jgi:hypothetical protein
MALNRSQILKELEPGLHAIFGEEYARYENEHEALFDIESSDRAFEEEVLFPGFGAAVVKPEGQGVSYAETGEGWVSRYNHETVALAFAITEESMEDNLYESLSKRLSKSLARSMAHTKQVKGANVYNRAFNSSYTGGDGVELCSTAHTMQDGNTWANEPTVSADLSETSLEAALIAIAGFTDDRSIPIAAQARTLHIPRQLVFVAERVLKSPLRVGTADNDLNALATTGSVPGGVFVNHRFTDADAWFLRTDCPDSMKMFDRVSMDTKMEGDFETGNVRYKARERYSFGWSDPRGVYGSDGA